MALPVRRRVRAHRGAGHGLDQRRASSSSRSSRRSRSSAFLRYESRRRDPFIDLRFFRSIPFASATMIAVCAFAAWGAFLFMMSLYLQDERGFSAMHTGLIYLPVAVGALIFSPLSGRLVGRFGSRPSLLIAGTLITAATVMLTRLTATTPVWQLLIDLRGVRHRLLDGERADHQRGGQRHADRSGRRGLGGGLDQPAGRRQYRCGAVRFGRRLRRWRPPGTDFAVGGPAAVVRLRRPRVWSIFALGFYSTSPRGAALGRAARAADRRTGCPTGGRRCQRNPLADEVWRAMAALVIDNRDSWKRAVVEETGLPFSRIRHPATAEPGADDGQAGRRRRRPSMRPRPRWRSTISRSADWWCARPIRPTAGARWCR